MTEQKVDYASILPRDLTAGMVARFYVASNGKWGADEDCEVKKVSKVKRPAGTRYAVTIVHAGLPNGHATRYVTPQRRVTVRTQIDSLESP